MPRYEEGQEIKVDTRTIQRSTGAAWKGEKGKILAVSGDGYRIKFGSGFIADNVKDNEIEEL
jgi:hypothetical protein